MGSALADHPPSKPYHHGDLRAALVTAGMELLATRTVDDLSLREVARAVGVSANAVYRHFPDKDALMRALSAEGLRALAQVQRSASEIAGGGAAGFRATGKAYVRFALARPALFRLIFSSPATTTMLYQPGNDVPDAMAFLRVNAAAVAGPGQDAEAVALRAWAIAHGLSLLMLDKQIAADEEIVDAVFVDVLADRDLTSA